MSEESNGKTRHPVQWTKRWSPLIVLSTAVFIIIIDTSIMNVSISQVVKDLNTNVTSVQGVITLYSLVLAALMITGGKLGDIWGRRRTLVIGTVIFAIGTGITGFATNMGTLIIGWAVLEGIGGALMLPAILTLISINYKGRSRAFAFATIGMVMAVGNSAGPIVGGWITNNMGWRWAFRLELIFAFAVLAYASVIKDRAAERKPQLDYLGTVLSAAGLGVMVFGILQASKWGFLEPKNAPFTIFGLSPVPFIIAAGLIILGLFTLWQRRREKVGDDPLINLDLFRIRAASSGLIIITFQFIVQAGLLFAIPLYMQSVMGLDALATGIGLLPFSIALLIVSLAAPGLRNILYPKYIIQVGLLLMTGACFLLSFGVGVGFTRTDLIPGLALLGAGVGLLVSQLTNMVPSAPPAHLVSDASAATNTFRNVGGSIGTALIGAVLIGALISGVGAGLKKSTILTARMKEEVASSVEKDAQVVSRAKLESTLKGVPNDQKQEILRINTEAEAHAFKVTMIAAAIVSILGFFFSFLIPKEKFSRKEEEPDASS